MTVAPAHNRRNTRPPSGRSGNTQPAGPPTAVRPRVGPFPWAMAFSVAVAVCGAALSLNGVLRGWGWYLPVLSTVLAVSLSLAVLRALRAQPLLVTAGGFLSLAAVLTLTFFRSSSIAGFIPTGATLGELDRLLRRASETVLAETAPVAPNTGIVMVCCAILGLAVILVDALAVPLRMPAATGVGLLALLVVPAVIKPQSVGPWAFTATAAGYLMILAFSQWFVPQPLAGDGVARTPGQARRAALTGAAALAATLVLSSVVPGFDQGTFPQGSRLNPWGASTGLNPMITLGNSLRTPEGSGRITYATTATAPLYLRSVTVDNFDGESWGPDDRTASRVPLAGRIDPGYDVPADDQQRIVTAIDAGTFTSPYLPAPYAPETVLGLSGRWTWDPATLTIKGTDTTSRRQEYIVVSTAPAVTAELLAGSPGRVEGIPEEFTRVPGNVPAIVRATAEEVAGPAGSPYERAVAIQRFLRSGAFTYSLESPVQGGYDGNGLSVLADFLDRKSGYCVHYASAMAVMARLQGIPSRIAVGYAPGRLTGATVSIAGQGDLAEYEVDARDAHAWPELYFQGLGWVPFEPTPSRGVVPPYATGLSAPTSPGNLDNGPDLLPGATAPSTAQATASAEAVPGIDAGAGTAGKAGSGPLLAGLGAVLAALLLAAAPRMVRLGIRGHRLRQAAAGMPGPGWHELVDLGRDYGLPPLASETPRAYAARFRDSLLGGADGPDHQAHSVVQALTADFERHEYGRPGGQRAVPDVALPDEMTDRFATLAAALRTHATLWRRLRVEWLPPSVTARVGRWLSAPFRAAGRAAAALLGRLRYPA